MLFAVDVVVELFTGLPARMHAKLFYRSPHLLGGVGKYVEEHVVRN